MEYFRTAVKKNTAIAYAGMATMSPSYDNDIEDLLNAINNLTESAVVDHLQLNKRKLTLTMTHEQFVILRGLVEIGSEASIYMVEHFSAPFTE